ncbi:MAG: hypothetical protein IT292_08195 [Deltaproteobacteria bacterium]|nr:hypothetical protein [Deltaproteobacteria bacterium]
MIHQWCIVVPKTKQSKEALSTIIRDRVISRLTIKPELLITHEISSWAFLFSASGNCSLFKYQSPVLLNDNDATIISGLPTFEQSNYSADGDIVSYMQQAFLKQSPQTMFTSIGGDWQGAYCDQEQITALYSFSGYFSLYYLNNDNYFVLSNRPAIASQFYSAQKAASFNHQALSWIYSTTMILGHETPYQEVYKLSPGNYLLYERDKGLTINSYQKNFYTPITFTSEQEKEEYLRNAVKGLMKKVSWCFGRNLPLQAHLTGGKDSRALLALLLASGAIDKLQKISTYGDDVNGDVIVARMVMKYLGLEDKHEVKVGMKIVEIPDHDSLIRRLQFSSPYYDAYLTPYDGTRCAAQGKSELISFMGGGGEIYRQKHYRSFSDLAQIIKQFTNWSYPYNCLNILSAEAKDWQMNELEMHCSRLLDEGICNHQAKFYIDHRLSNWGSAHYQNNQSGSIAALNDINLARYAFSSDDIGEDIHFYIMQTACPEILQVPFSNCQWTGRTGETAKQYQCLLDPVKSEACSNFPWQFDTYSKYRNAFLRFIYRHLDLFDRRLDANAIKKLLASAIDPFNSAHIKMLFGAVSHVFWLGGIHAAPRNWSSCREEVKQVGNCANGYSNIDWDKDDADISSHHLYRELAKDLAWADKDTRYSQYPIYRKAKRLWHKFS